MILLLGTLPDFQNNLPVGLSVSYSGQDLYNNKMHFHSSVFCGRPPFHGEQKVRTYILF